MRHNRKKAAGLKYDYKYKHVPEVVATGQGLLAGNIIQKAKENEIPILEDPTLVELLSELNINETVPEELYEAVAEVFAFIYHTDKQMGE